MHLTLGDEMYVLKRLHECVHEQMDGYMDEWTDGWMVRQIDKCTVNE